jgi:hypothetical protein
MKRSRRVIFDRIERDDDNLDHATRRATAAEIEQAIFNARRAVPESSQQGPRPVPRRHRRR